MKYILLVVLLCCAGCFPPKYHYSQQMLVSQGFYKGQKGEIIKYHPESNSYDLILENGATVSVQECELTPVGNSIIRGAHIEIGDGEIRGDVDFNMIVDRLRAD